MATPAAHEPRGSIVTRVLARLITSLLRNRSVALGSVALVVCIAALGLVRLRVDFSSTSFYAGGSEPAQRLAEFQATWGADDNALLILVHPSQADDPRGVLASERLAAIAELARALEDGDQVAAVTSVATAPLPAPRLTPRLTPGLGSGPFEPIDLATIVKATKLDELDPAARRSILERLPFVPTLLSADGRETVIVVELGFSSDDVMRTKAAVDALEPILVAHDPRLQQLGLTRELAGIPAIRAGFFALIVHDQLILIPLMIGLIGLALLLVFRRVHGVLIPAAAAAVPTLMLVGVMGWLGEPIGLLNQAYFTLLPVILVADAIHMVARYDEERRNLGPRGDNGRAIIRAGSQVGLACLLTSVTTAAGFASLALADMPILRSFGIYAAIGVGLGFVMVVILVPLLLSFVRDDRSVPELPGFGPIDALVRFATARPWLILGVTIAVLGLALIPAKRVQIDNTLTGLLSADHPTSIASRRVDTQLGGVLGLEFELHAPPGVSLCDPEPLAAIYGFEQWLAEQPEVRAVEGLASIVAGTHGLSGGRSTIPETRAMIDAQLDAIAPFAPLDRYSRDHGQTLRIHASLPDDGGRGFVEFAARAEAELARRLTTDEPWAGIRAQTTGTPLLAYQGVNRITHDLRSSFVLVFVIVIALIACLFRSGWPALISLLPNGLPLVLGYASIALVGQVLDPLAAVILILALGIAVDDTLHIFVRTREERREGVGLDEALRRAINHSGRAVAATSIVIAAGLALNLGSSFPPLQMLGWLGGLVIMLALLGDLLVLPALIVLVRGRGLNAP